MILTDQKHKNESIANKQKLKIVSIIEDDDVIRNNLIRFFEMTEDIQIGITANSVEQYIELSREYADHSPTTLLLDIGLPGMSGLDGIPHILKLHPAIDIIMLTTFEEEQKILKAICLGAVAYLSKRTSLTDIVEAIRVIANGGSYMSPMIARDIFTYILNANLNPYDDMLTDRQQQVIKGLVDGKSHVEIAKELFISHETVRTHVKNIYKILHVKNKAEAITKYLKRKL